jgi:hypothetical protein
MAQRQNTREQYTAPEPMRVELKNQSHEYKVSRLVFVPHPLLLSRETSYRFAYLEWKSDLTLTPRTLLGTPSRANFKTYDELDRRLRFIREAMLPM